jgi:hypothetical protein
MPVAVALGVALGGGLISAVRLRRRRRAGRELSVARARAHLRRIARSPRPTGSAAAAAVRDYLAAELERLGMSVRVRTAVATGGITNGGVRSGRIENVHAVPAGPARPDGRRLLLVAHYDSVPGSPGAADDGAGVATLLEVARVLLRDGERGFEVLFTDGEESGLLGARAYVNRMSPADRDRTVVINLDAGGNRGRPVVFEAGPDLTRVRPALRVLAPAVTSLADALYHRLPNDTDLTAFRGAGVTGINLGLVGGSAVYHTGDDTVANLDPRSLAALLADTLAAARALLRDCPEGRPRRGHTYFPVAGRLVSYPGPLDLALGSGSVLVTAMLGRTRAAAVLSAPLPAVAGVIAGRAGWRVVRAVRPHYRGFASGDPYRAGPAAAGEMAVTLAAAAALARWIAGRLPDAEHVSALQGWLGAAAVCGGALLPGSGYLAAWPAALATSCLAAERAYGRELPTLRATVLGGSLAALALPAAALLRPALGLRRTAAPLAILGTVSGVVLPALTAQLEPARVGAANATLAAAGVAFVAAGLLRDRADARHPAHVSMSHLRDADTGTAFWLGDIGAPGTWEPAPPSPALFGQFPGTSRSWPRWRPAVPLPTPEPAVRLIRRAPLEIGVSAPESVYAVTLRLIIDGPGRPAVTIDGHPFPATRTVGGRWLTEVRFVSRFRDPLRIGVVAGHARLATVVAAAHSRLPIESVVPPGAPATWTTGAAGEALTVRRLEVSL